MMTRPVLWLWSWLILTSGVTLTWTQSGVAAENALFQIHNTHIALLQTAAAFHQYQGSEGDPKYQKQLNGQLTYLIEETAKTGNLLKNNQLQPLKARLENHLTALKNELETAIASISTDGYVEFAIADAYVQASNELAFALQDAKRQFRQTAKTTQADQLRDLALLMQDMYTRYIERANSRFGFSYRSGQVDEADIDELAERFGKQLDTLIDAQAESEPTAAKLRDMRDRWRFLAPSFINYTEKNVPHLVTRFCSQMVKELGELAQQAHPG
jgi:hypothetical protein